MVDGADKLKDVGGNTPRHLQSSISTELLYANSFKAVEVKEIKGKKVAVIRGELMNCSKNGNDWGIKSTHSEVIANQVKNIAVKLNHGDDREIIGTGEFGTVNPDGSIGYELTIADPNCVAKCESGSWNERNMGVSPHLDYSDMECSVCGHTLRESLEAGTEIKRNSSGITDLGCGHIIGKDAYIIPVEPRLLEITMTSDPAYAPVGSGTITNMAVMTASINKLCSSFVKPIEIKAEEISKKSKMEAETMAETIEKEKVDQLLAKKDAEIIELKAELKDKSDADIETLKAEVKKSSEEKKIFLAEKKTFSEEVETLKASIKEKDTFIAEVIKKQREVELQAVISDAELVAEILSKKMTEDEFTAEITKLKKVMELAAQTTTTGGSAPAETSTEKDTFKATFGCTTNEYLEKMGITKKE